MVALAIVLAAVSVHWPSNAAGRGEEVDANESLSRFKAETLDRHGPYQADQRWSTYQAMSALYERYWLQPASRRTLSERPSVNLDTAIFRIEDRDEDGEGEFFAYLPLDGSEDTQDFGAFFDLSGNGKPDWIVFYGGSAFTSQASVFWWHQHGIDSNGDGSFDIRVLGMVDTDGDGFPEEGSTTWVFDSDHDGLVDRAEHVVDGEVTPIEPNRGYLPLGWVISPELENQPRIGDPVSSLFNTIAADIAVQSR